MNRILQSFLGIIFVTFVYNAYIFMHHFQITPGQMITFKIVPQDEIIQMDTESFNYVPCKYAVATAMCRGKEPAKDFPRQLRQATGMVKSILHREKYYRRPELEDDPDSCTDILILSDHRKNFEQLLDVLRGHGYDENAYKNIRFVYVPAAYPPGCEHYRNLYGPCASIRLFLDRLIPNYDSVIYTDTDVVFLQNIQHLWKEIENFPPQTWAAFGPDQYGIEYHHIPFYGDRGLNSGVAFLNLTRMRKSEFFDRIKPIQKIFRAKSGLPDQDFLNFYFHKHPREIKYLNCGRNFLFIFCWKGRACEEDSIEILHGTGTTFQMPTRELLMRGIFRIILRTRLDLNITTQEFARRFENSFEHDQISYRNHSDCLSNTDNFPELILKNIRWD